MPRASPKPKIAARTYWHRRPPKTAPMHPAADHLIQAPKAVPARVVLATIIGNAFVAYDFTVYSFSAVIIGKLFFPSHNPLSSLLLSLATFGAGFVMRPLGAIIIGQIANSRGRKAGMTWSLAFMTLGTWLIACLPTVASIGPAATMLMVIARLMQGLAAGGEIGPASAVLMESVPRNRRCYLTSWRGASQGAAAFAAAMVGAITTALLSPADMQEWGWRIPFVLGGLIGPVGWYLRRRMPSVVIEVPTRPRLAALFAEHARPLFYGTLMMAAPSIGIYITVFYMPSYLVRTLHRPPVISLIIASLSGLVILVVNPLVARIADGQQRRKPIQYVALLACLALTYPAFLALRMGVGDVTALLIILAYVAVALSNAGASTVMMLEAFAPQHRAAALSIMYSFGVAIFGGFSPLIVTWLIAVTGNPMMPAWYLTAAIGITLFALQRFPEKAPD
jgi:MFS transporter, MHS family, proline/betaine transporter